MKISTALLTSLVILSGCSANENSIFRTYQGEDNRVALIDAKQRAILSNELPEQKDKNGNALPTTRYCAEPSPDVFSVLSSATSASGTFSNSSGTEAALQLARSVNEAGASFGLRTQTIQVLRDMMYRSCERFLDGAITADEFSIQAARDQRIIVSIMAIEQLTGAVQPRPVVLNATAEADAGANVAQLQILLDDARAELKKTEDDQKLALTTQKDAATKKQTADAELAKDKENADKKAAAKKSAEDLEAADAHLEKANQEVADRKKNVEAAKKQIERARNVAARGAAGGFVSAASASADSAKEVAKVVERIVAMTFDVDEVALTCLKSLEKADASKNNNVNQRPGLDFCLSYLDRKSAEEKNRSAELLKEFNAIKAEDLFGKQP